MSDHPNKVRKDQNVVPAKENNKPHVDSSSVNVEATIHSPPFILTPSEKSLTFRGAVKPNPCRSRTTSDSSISFNPIGVPDCIPVCKQPLQEVQTLYYSNNKLEVSTKAGVNRSSHPNGKPEKSSTNFNENSFSSTTECVHIQQTTASVVKNLKNISPKRRRKGSVPTASGMTLSFSSHSISTNKFSPIPTDTFKPKRHFEDHVILSSKDNQVDIKSTPGKDQSKSNQNKLNLRKSTSISSQSATGDVETKKNHVNTPNNTGRVTRSASAASAAASKSGIMA